MSDVVIKVLDPVWSSIVKGRQLVAPSLLLRTTFWVQGPYRKEAREGTKTLIWKGGLFYTGHLHRVLDYCKQQNLSCETSGRDGEHRHWALTSPSVPEVSLRPDQLNLVDKATTHSRGIIKAPTGSGKTIVAMAIMSCFPDKKILFLCHTRDLVTQTHEELKKHGFRSVGKIVGGSDRNIAPHQIVVSTMQSFVKIPPENYCTEFDIVMVDEAHHLTSFTGTYAKILGKCAAPVRLGFTATLPISGEAKMAMEAFLGPVIGELTLAEGMDLGLLAKPRIHIVRVPFSSHVKRLRKYQEVYEFGVVKNRARNRLVAKTAMEYAEDRKTSLIIVTVIEHGYNIIDMAHNIYGLDMEYVQGGTEGEIRDRVKSALLEKRIMSVVCTATGGGVWREGINIPTLDVIINAAGGRSELALLQMIGRGMRTTKDKTEMVVVDLFDRSHYYLIEHFGERLWVYSEMEWL